MKNTHKMFNFFLITINKCNLLGKKTVAALKVKVETFFYKFYKYIYFGLNELYSICFDSHANIQTKSHIVCSQITK